MYHNLSEKFFKKNYNKSLRKNEIRVVEIIVMENGFTLVKKLFVPAVLMRSNNTSIFCTFYILRERSPEELNQGATEVKLVVHLVQSHVPLLLISKSWFLQDNAAAYHHVISVIGPLLTHLRKEGLADHCTEIPSIKDRTTDLNELVKF